MVSFNILIKEIKLPKVRISNMPEYIFNLLNFRKTMKLSKKFQ